MSKYSKYKLYQKYETRGSQEAIPCYPNVFSIDGDGTMPLVIVEENSRDCGYTGETQPIYRWYTLPIDTYYYCDACQDAQYKWVNLPISQDWECDGTTKYYKQKKQVSVDGGSTWTDVVPPQYQRGALYEQNSSSCGYITRTSSGSPYCEGYDKYVEVYSQYSTDGGNTWQTTATTPTMVEHNSAYCGYIEPQYRTTSGATYCSGYNKYVPVYSQVSYDGGVTWETTATTQTLVERNSPDCGYGYKLRATFSDSSYYDIVCNSDPVIRMFEAQDNHVTGMTSLDIGTCVTEITKCAFDNGVSYPNLVSVTLPNTLTTIGNGAFQGCDALASITIPDSVTSISDSAFHGCNSLSSATIGSGVTNINFFWECANLRRLNSNVDGVINIPSGVTAISFYDCPSFTSITIPNTVTSVSMNRCSGLTSIVMPDSVTQVGAFQGCTGLTTVEIGTGVTSIGGGAFQGCSGLTSITIKATTPPTAGEWAFNDGTGCPIYVPCDSVEAYKTASDWSNFKNRIRPIQGTCTTKKFKGTYSNATTYQMACDSNTTLTSGDTRPNGYTYTAMTSAEVGDCVTTIGGRAFGDCTSLTSVTIGSGVTTIGGSAFEDCSSLTSIDIPNSVTNIDGWVFLGCSNLREITIPSGVTSISDFIFGNCTSLTSVTIPDSVTTIGTQAFYRCLSLPNITLPSGVTSIGGTAFSGCTALTSVTILAATPPTLGYGAFQNTTCIFYVPCESLSAYGASSDWSDYANRIYGIPPCNRHKLVANYSNGTSYSADCNSNSALISEDTRPNGYTYTAMTSAEVGDCVTSIGDFAFQSCTSLSSVTIPSGVTSIGIGAFAFCSSLTSINIPSGVTSIDNSAFMGCTSLTSITVNSTTPPTLGNYVFDDTNNCPIYVPSASVNTYKSSSGDWSRYTSRIQAIP